MIGHRLLSAIVMVGTVFLVGCGSPNGPETSTPGPIASPEEESAPSTPSLSFTPFATNPLEFSTDRTPDPNVSPVPTRTLAPIPPTPPPIPPFSQALPLIPDGGHVAIGSSSGVYVYTLPDFERVWRKLTKYPVRQVSFSPDGSRLLTGDDYQLWNANTGVHIRDLDGWRGGMWSPDGRKIAIQAFPGTKRIAEDRYVPSPERLYLYDGISGLPIRTLDIDPPEEVEAYIALEEVIWADGGDLLVAIDQNALLRTWRISSREQQVISTYYYYHDTLSVSPDGKYFSVSGSKTDDEWYGMVYEASSGEIVFEMPSTTFRWLSDGRLFRTQSSTPGEITMRTYQPGSWLPGKTMFVPLSDEVSLLIRGETHDIRFGYDSIAIYDPVSKTTLFEGEAPRQYDQFSWALYGLSERVKLRGDTLLITDGLNVRVWDLGTGAQVGEASTRLPLIEYARVDDRYSGPYLAQVGWVDNQTLALALPDGSVTGQVLQGTQLVPLELTLDQISRVYFPIVGEYLGYGRVQMGRVYQSHGADWASVQKNEVEIDGATFWEIPEPLTEYDNMALAWSTNDRYLAFSAGNESLLEGPFVGSAPIWPRRWVIWDMEARLPVVDISYPHLALIEDRSSAVRGSPLCLAWSPDDQLLAQGFSLAFDSGIPSHEIRLTDPFTGEIIATLSGHSGSVIALAFSPDGTKLASVSWDGTLIIWDVSEYLR